MIEIGKKYEVHDVSGSFWGSVCLKYPFMNSSLGIKNISGYLEATSEFSEIQYLFLEHDEFMTSNEIIEDEGNNAVEIAQLGVVISDPETGEIQHVDPVYVSGKLLFTCSFDKEKI